MTESTPTTVEEAIESVALGMVTSSSENGRSMDMIPLQDLVEAAKYLRRNGAATKPHFGLRITKCIPPGGG